MYNIDFIDQIKIHCKSGDGGPGALHFRREKFIPNGGPDGGNGGNGGSIFLLGSRKLCTLYNLKYKRYHHAKNGFPGMKNIMSGGSGEDIILQVPIGTVAKNEQGDILCEITKDGQKEIILKGGLGGRGNWYFRNSVNRAPSYAQPGLPGLESCITLELKILSDVCIVGCPNAGKSTLFSGLTEYNTKIADYAFTTLVPQLGVVHNKDYNSFVISDIPGIIEGSSIGKGIGHSFFRHLERNTLLILLIPSNTNIMKEYEIILKEIYNYDPKFLKKEKILVISKSDLIDSKIKKYIKNKIPFELKPIFISSHYKKGLKKLKSVLLDKLNKRIQ